MCQAAIVVVLSGGLGYLPGNIVYHAAIVELVTWLGLTAIGVCVLAGDPCVSGRYSGRLPGA